MGGKHLATHIDERMVAVLGGVLFLVFGVCWFDVYSSRCPSVLLVRHASVFQVHSLIVGPPVDG